MIFRHEMPIEPFVKKTYVLRQFTSKRTDNNDCDV